MFSIPMRIGIYFEVLSFISAYRPHDQLELWLSSANHFVKRNSKRNLTHACPDSWWEPQSASLLGGGSSAIKPIMITCGNGSVVVLKPQNTKKVPPSIDENYHQLQEVAGAEVTDYITEGKVLVPTPITVTQQNLEDFSSNTGIGTEKFQAALVASEEALSATFAIIMPLFHGRDLSEHIPEFYNFKWVLPDGNIVDLSSADVKCAKDTPDICDITPAGGKLTTGQTGLVRITMKDSIPDGMLLQLFAHMLADYIIGNTDFHTENYMIDEAQTSLIALDKGQAFRYFQSSTGLALDATPWWDISHGVTLRAYAARKNHGALCFACGQMPKMKEARAAPKDFCPFWHMNFQYQILGAGNLPLSGPLVTQLNHIRLKQPDRWNGLIGGLRRIAERAKALPGALPQMLHVVAFGKLSHVVSVLGSTGFITEIERRSALPLDIDSPLCPVDWSSPHIPARMHDVIETLSELGFSSPA